MIIPFAEGKKVLDELFHYWKYILIVFVAPLLVFHEFFHYWTQVLLFPGDEQAAGSGGMQPGRV